MSSNNDNENFSLTSFKIYCDQYCIIIIIVIIINMILLD